MLKKVTLGLIALGVSASALAAGPGADVPIPAAPASINVTAPVQHGSWEVGLEAGYYKPSNSDFQYAQVQQNSSSAKDYVFKNRSVDPGYAWSGHADVTFNIPGNGRYVSLGYTHLSADDNSSVKDYDNNGNGTSIISTPFNNGIYGSTGFGSTGAPGAPSTGGYDYVKGSTSTDYNDLDLVFGQKIDVGHRVRMKFFGGLRYASIDTKGKVTGTATGGSSETYTDVGKIKSDFSGIGPRAGVDTQVNLGAGFSIVGRIAGSLLVGDVSQKVTVGNTVCNSAGQVTSSSSATLKSSSDTRVVPEADARLGLHYNYGFNPSTSMGFELGYQVVNYFDAGDNDLVDAVVPNTVKGNNDWGFHGPYLRAQLNIA